MPDLEPNLCRAVHPGGTALDDGFATGFRVVVGPLTTSDHCGFLVVGADEEDAVREFAVRPRPVWP